MSTESAARPPHRPYAGEAPEQRIARRRAAFIAAGRTLFSSLGYRKTTVRALCAEAGLTDRYFYESFASVEDLLVAVYEELMDAMQGRILAAVQATAGGDIEALIEASLDAYFREVEDAAAARVIWMEVLGVSPRVDAVYIRRTRDFADLLQLLNRTLVPDWNPPAAVAAVVALGLTGAASEAARGWIMEGYRRPRQELVQGIALLFKGLLALARQGGDAPPPA